MRWAASTEIRRLYEICTKANRRMGLAGGALYGKIQPVWREGLSTGPYSDRQRPWLWRVGASVHPGGGIPGVLGGAMISTGRLLKALEDR